MFRDLQRPFFSFFFLLFTAGSPPSQTRAHPLGERKAARKDRKHSEFTFRVYYPTGWSFLNHIHFHLYPLSTTVRINIYSIESHNLQSRIGFTSFERLKESEKRGCKSQSVGRPREKHRVEERKSVTGPSYTPEMRGHIIFSFNKSLNNFSLSFHCVDSLPVEAHFPFLYILFFWLDTQLDSVRPSGGGRDVEGIPFQSHFGTLSQFLAEEAEVGRLAHGVRVAVRLVPVVQR